ncbi:MAG: AarF/ABC1/UbiB kinase family protein, partial [Methanosarcinales archaeon]|nr:AarF/ABC1/UbiB kinase family protein [Methanosarcinales archaeon]
HVLTLEYAIGVKINNIERIERVGLDCKKVARNFSTAYVKMLFEDGFFHGDPHPGNVFVMPDEVILFLDFGMVGTISKSMMESMTNIMIATVKKDIEVLIDSLVEMGVVDPDDIDMLKFRAELAELVESYYTVSLKNVSPDVLLKELIDLLMEHHGKVPSNIMLLSKTLMMEEEINTRLDPDYNLAEVAEPFVHDLFRKRSRPDQILKDAAKTGLEFAALLRKLPRKVDRAMGRLEKGSLKLEFEHKGLDMVVGELDTMSNRISFALIISAIIVGSSLILQTDMTPQIYDAPILGILGFIVAGVMGFGLVLSIIRSGKL